MRPWVSTGGDLEQHWRCGRRRKWGARGLPGLAGRGGRCGHRTAAATKDSRVFAVPSMELAKACSVGVVFPH